nr:EOG090X0JRY [Eulimnadia texana]
MELASDLIRVSLPNYLAGLPIPRSVGGWFKLGFKDWLYLVPFGAAVAGISYLTYEKIHEIRCGKCQGAINPGIKKDVSKVVDSVDIEDINKKTSYCRCWRSATFPYCDGSHNKHNQVTGDNVGPLVINKKDV